MGRQAGDGIKKLLAKARRRVKEIPHTQAKQMLEDLAAVRNHSDVCAIVMARNITRAFTGGFWSKSVEDEVMRCLGRAAFPKK
jgi:hypothetical protein